MTLSRRMILAGLVAGAARPVLGQTASAGLRAVPAEDLVRAADLGGEVAYLVADARSGLVLESRGANRPMPPASTAKAITALYALEALGPGHRFSTRLIATGPVAGGVVQGDLVLAGGGDPTLNTDDLAQMAAKLRARGVAGVAGRFLVWAGALPYAREIADDQPVHVGYNPSVSGLILNHNRVHFEWRRAQGGYALTMDARGERHRPKAYTAAMDLANRKGPLFTYAEQGGKERWSVAQAALGKQGSRWLPVRRPELYAGDVFQTLARAQGVPLPAPQPVAAMPGGTVLVEHASAELRPILRDMLRYSTNITAEAVGMSASLRLGAAAGHGESGRAMAAWLRTRAGVEGARFADHSGLGAASRISAAEMVAALARLAPQHGLRPILRNFAMRDANGREDKAHPIRVAAKTGTLNFVSSLAGFMTAPDGTELVFAILTGDLARRARAAQTEQPEGNSAWLRRSRRLQQQLIERWGALYGT